MYPKQNDLGSNSTNSNSSINNDEILVNDKHKSICFFSYNTRGFGEDKQDVCKILTIKNKNYIPILCNQENFLLHGNRRKVEQCLPESKVYFKKAIKDSLHSGRAKNGMFIAIPKFMEQNTKNVSPDHWRIQAITLNFPNNKILVINSYFPTDPRLKEFDTDDLFSTLTAIKDILDSVTFDKVIWMGDINADFARDSQFTKYVHEFISDNSLQRSW